MTSAPGEIVALLESVVGIYISGVRHRDRAAFILCDELVEMSCKMRAREFDYKFDMRSSFYDATDAPGVKLDPNGLGKIANQNRQTRNQMQHGSAAATVDDEHCANAILMAMEVIEHCWPGAPSADFKPWLSCALRIVKLYSTQGDERLRQPFEDVMRDLEWTTEQEEKLRPNEIGIRPGLRAFWHYTCSNYVTEVEEELDKLEI